MNNFNKYKDIIKTALKITAVLIFTTVILLQGNLHTIIFKSFEAKYKKEVKQIIKAGLPENNLITHKFHRSIFNEVLPNFKWIKKYEYRFNNEMYDVINSEFKGDSVYFLVYHDMKESKLFKNLDDKIADLLEQNPNKKNEITLLVLSLNKFFVLHNYPNLNNSQTAEISYNSFGENLKLGFLQMEIPPPNNLTA